MLVSTSTLTDMIVAGYGLEFKTGWPRLRSAGVSPTPNVLIIALIKG